MTKKRKNKVIIIIASILLLIVIGLGLAGNYLVEYAIARSGDGGNRNVNTDNIQEKNEPAEQSKIDIKKDEIKKETKFFLQKNPYEQAQIKSKDGLNLKGFYLENSPDSNANWVLLIHGYRAEHDSMNDYAKHYYEAGYNVLLPDLRASGESEGNYVGMGWLEKDDAKIWIDWIIERQPSANIIVHGVSMGAATTMMLSGDETKENVKMFIEDCGYTSAWDIFANEAKLRFNLPSFPLLNVSSALARVKAGYSFSEADALKQVGKSTKPMLFIHGMKDDFVPFYMLDELYNAKTEGAKDKFVSETAGHADSIFADYSAYWAKVEEFIQANMPE